jgi:hypothetical protein
MSTDREAENSQSFLWYKYHIDLPNIFNLWREWQWKSSIHWAFIILLPALLCWRKILQKYFDREGKFAKHFQLSVMLCKKISTLMNQIHYIKKISRSGHELEGATARPYSYC